MGSSLIPWLQSWSHERRAELKELIGRQVEADHPQLLKHIQNMFVPPSLGRRKIFQHDPITPQAQRAKELLNNKASVISACHIVQLLVTPWLWQHWLLRDPPMQGSHFGGYCMYLTGILKVNIMLHIFYAHHHK